jgi:hypothetical protein
VRIVGVADIFLALPDEVSVGKQAGLFDHSRYNVIKIKICYYK